MSLQYTDNKTPYSSAFGDVYFSKEDGLAESRHVFLAGNGLSGEDWPRQARIRICETGFGTGLNFLAMAALFDQRKRAGQKLFYTAIEKHPLQATEIKTALRRWSGELTHYAGLIRNYPMRISGFHPVQIAEDIFLTLIFDDVKDAMPELIEPQDYWFLDGFAPAQNPEMWSEKLFDHMARLSHKQSRFATFTAAGFVRRALESRGFATEKIKGFGRKREMLIGGFTESKACKDGPQKIDRVTIAGAGLAGLSCGWLLQRLGLEVQILEKNKALHQNASSNKAGLINPRIGAMRIPAYDYFNGAYALFTRLHGQRYNPIGAKHFPADETKRTRFDKFKSEMNWPEEELEKSKDHLLFQSAGICNVRDLCDVYAKDLDISYGHSVNQANIWATSFNTPFSLPLDKIRGQVSYGTIPQGHEVKTLYSYGGYHAPLDERHISFGATFQRWIDHDDVTQEDHAYNLAQLHRFAPDLAKDLQITDGWAGFRCASKDRLPVIGPYQVSFLSIAHGSHGMISSLAAAHIIAFYLGLIPQPFGKTVLNALSPLRYSGAGSAAGTDPASG